MSPKHDKIGGLTSRATPGRFEVLQKDAHKGIAVGANVVAESSANVTNHTHGDAAQLDLLVVLHSLVQEWRERVKVALEVSAQGVRDEGSNREENILNHRGVPCIAKDLGADQSSGGLRRLWMKPLRVRGQRW